MTRIIVHFLIVVMMFLGVSSLRADDLRLRRIFTDDMGNLKIIMENRFPRLARTIWVSIVRLPDQPRPVEMPLTVFFERPMFKGYSIATVAAPHNRDLCNLRYTVMIDSRGSITETDEDNNSITDDLAWAATYARIEEPIRVAGVSVPRDGNVQLTPGRVSRIIHTSRGIASHVEFNVTNFRLRNCGYKATSRGRLVVSQIGNFAAQPGALPHYQEIVVADRSASIRAGLYYGRPLNNLRFAIGDSQMRIEYIWADPGEHNASAVYTVNLAFAGF